MATNKKVFCPYCNKTLGSAEPKIDDMHEACYNNLEHEKRQIAAHAGTKKTLTRDRLNLR